MKTWNTPEIRELNISATESGFFNSEVEFWIITNDSERCTPEEDPS